MANRLPSITIEGGKELTDLLTGFTDKELIPAVQKGMRNVGSKTMRDARTHLTKNRGVDTGQLRKSLGVRKIIAYRREGRVVMYLGPRRGFSIQHPRTKKNHDPFYIAHLIEFGHRIAVRQSTGRPELDYVLPHIRNKGGAPRYATGKKMAVSAGFVKAIPFLRPAVDSNRREFTNQMAAKLRDVLTRAKAKRGK